MRQNNTLDNQKLLEHLGKVKDRLDEVKFDDSAYDNATFFAYEDTNSKGQTLSKTDWIQIRQTALDQLARY